MASRLVLYGVVSTLGAASVVGSALHTRANFFAAAVTIGRSSGAKMVLANFALFNVICFGIVIKTIFFGRLRSIEYEHLFERLWLFLTESLLALTIFRDDFSAPFAIMYGILLFLKCFHWITADRVDYMDQIPPPGPPTIFHIRCSLIIGLLTLMDCALVLYSLESIVLDGVSAMVLFASEFMILLASIGGTTARYVVGLIDLRRARGREDAPSWEEKSMYLFYVDLAVDFVKLLTYLSFFLVILLNYGLPLHILRDVYMTLKSFLSRCSDLVRYRRATRDMDALYPNATAGELERSGDRTCIICREEMIPHQPAGAPGAPPAGATAEGGPNETPKRLQCGHIFHFHCLRSWLERQQSCPTCRRDVLRPPTIARPRPNGMIGPNGVNVQINPPPPAPGAVPRVGAIPGAANPIQAVYEQYFRPPQPANQAAPTPAPITGGTAAQPTATATAGSSDADNGLQRDQQIQRGIWGGPIAPGRFFATPLGAAPVWPPIPGGSYQSQRPLGPLPTGTRSQGVHMPVIRLPETIAESSGTSNDNSQSSTFDHSTRPSPLRHTSEVPPSSTSNLQSPVSGVNTPFTSNPPQIFSPAGSNAILEDESDGEAGEGAIEMSPGKARQAAAEAALRRMGLRNGKIAQSGAIAMETNREKAPAGAVAGDTASPLSNGSAPVDVKGKGRATISESPILATHPASSDPRAMPYLTLPGHDLVSRTALLGRSSSAGLTIDSTNQALEERLRLLKEVDEIVWGLVGELTRIQSGWPGGDRPEQDEQSSQAQ